jgi:hypothetical protein
MPKALGPVPNPPLVELPVDTTRGVCQPFSPFDEPESQR